MAKDPAVLFYTSDFLVQSTSLTLDERGAFITLLCLQHQQGHLNTKTIELSVGVAKMTDDVWNLFKKDNKGLFYNQWMEELIIKRKNYTKSRSENRKGKTKIRE